jgi:hypothetical protein
MIEVKRNEPLTKAEFHKRLREWMVNDDKQIGDISAHDRKAWIHVQSDSQLFQLHADTKRDAVKQYLDLVDSLGDDLQWEVVPSQMKKMSAVAFGPDKIRITSFYLYIA